MERSPIFLIEPVPGIKRQELDLGSLGQIGRLVNDESPGLHASLQSHAITVALQPLLHKAYWVRADGKPGGRLGRMQTNRREHSRRPNRARRTLAVMFGELRVKLEANQKSI